MRSGCLPCRRGQRQAAAAAPRAAHGLAACCAGPAAARVHRQRGGAASAAAGSAAAAGMARAGGVACAAGPRHSAREVGGERCIAACSTARWQLAWHFIVRPVPVPCLAAAPACSQPHGCQALVPCNSVSSPSHPHVSRPSPSASSPSACPLQPCMAPVSLTCASCFFSRLDFVCNCLAHFPPALSAPPHLPRDMICNTLHVLAPSPLPGSLRRGWRLPDHVK